VSTLTYPQSLPQAPFSLSPNAHRILDLFRWYWRKLGGCFPRQRYIASKIRKSVDTVQRAIKELVAAGLLKIGRRGPRSNVYEEIVQLPPSPQLSFDFAVSFAVSSEPASLMYEVRSKEHHEPERKPPAEAATPNASLPVGFDEQFQGYIGLFIAAQKPLSRVDICRAHAVWTGLDLPDRTAAVVDAHHTIVRRNNPRYIPFPVNHLLSQAWTRIAIPEREIEYIDPRAEDKRSEVDDWGLKIRNFLGGAA
jgi:hypothetical protein